MRVNMPVTGVERQMRDGETIVSTTDTRGVITHVNDTFVAISGFTRDELMGAPQNIVRNPDMPAAAFKDLWDTIQAGRPWVGLVKNRCKNGDHYWVEAHVTPIRQSGQITGYLSVRYKPGRDQIAQAETLYRALNEGKVKSLHATGIRVWLSRLSIKQRLAGIMALVVAMILVGTAIGMGGVSITNKDMQALYQSRLEPIRILGQVVRLMSENQTQVALTVQHDPTSPFAAQHDHPVERHVETIAANRDKITALLEEFNAIPLPEETAAAVAAFAEARARYVQEGLQPAMGAVKEGGYRAATQILLTKVNPLYADARDKMEVLRALLQDKAQADYQAAEARYHKLLTVGLVGMGLGIALAIWFAWMLIRAIARPLERTIGYFNQIAEGRYDNAIAIDRHDEVGRVLEALEAMQTKLGFDVQEAKRHADENLRVKIALDNVSANVMMADNGRNIIYMNKAVQGMFRNAEADIRKQL
ncbi:MAG: Tar ligand binding domain-containing protein, partial [Betaproteobacteria bacterium]|nr:Tar ligand binding domain-containing protein [Betaproteobacteria bacterium]